MDPNSDNKDARFRKIYVEIGNICNLQCTFCPEVEREKKRMDTAGLRAVLREIRPYTDRVCFHLMGEPLAHPEFPAFVKIAAEENVPLELTTNGTLLNESTEAALLDPTVHQVNFSLQSFFDNFPGASPDTYLARIFAFCQRALGKRPDLYLNLRLWNLLPNDCSDGRNEQLLLRLEREFTTQINRRVDPRLRKSKRIKNRLYLHYDTRFDWPSPLLPELGAEGSCQGTRTHVGIHADGTVVPCCLDKEARLSLGRMGEQSFSSILESPRLLEIKKGFEQGRLVEDLCRRCTYARRFT